MVLLHSDSLTSDESILEDVIFPPANLESDEPPLETDLHREQIELLIRLLKYWWRDGQTDPPQGYRSDFYISGNLTVYYNEKQLKSRDFRGPDVFVVLGVENKPRKSWTVWNEDGKYPNVVIELLSDSTATVDRGLKKDLYQDTWRVPNYFWFHPHTLEFAGFHLVDGRYETIAPTEQGRFLCDQLGLSLGLYEQQLRWFDENGDLIPFPEEQERMAKEQALKRVKELEEKMRSQGFDLDS